MLRVMMLLLALVMACGDDDGGGSGTGVSGSGGSSGAGATGGSAGTGGSGGSGGTGGTAGAAGTGGMAGAMSDASVDADVSDATADAAMDADTFDAATDAATIDASFDDASIDAAIDAATNTTDADVNINDGGTDATTIDAGADGSAVLDASVVGCRPGHYVGSMSGTYTSAAYGNGETPLALQTEASPGAPGLDLWLAPATTPCAPGAEFCADLEITMGVAHFTFPQAILRFDAVVTGALDCRTGELRGNLAADAFVLGLSFSGPMHASYDPDNDALTQGTWSVTEDGGTPCPVNATCGGSGTWSAMWVDSPWSDGDAGAELDAATVGDAGTTPSSCSGGEVCRTSSIAMGYLPDGQGFCAPDNDASLPPACSNANAACGPSGGTCLAPFMVCLSVCDLPN